MISISAIREVIAKSWIYFCYLIYPTLTSLFWLFVITHNSTILDILTKLSKPAPQPNWLWGCIIIFTFWSLVTFIIIILLGMIGRLLTLGHYLAKQMNIIIAVFGGCTLLIIFGFFLLLAGIGVFMIIAAFIFPWIQAVVGISDLNKSINLEDK